MSADRPHFELQAQTHKALPEGEQLFGLHELVGHTIKCVIEPLTLNKEKNHADFVIVTETMCWLALEAQLAGYCSEDGAEIRVCGNSWKRDQTMFDYLDADDLLENGLVNQPQHALLKQKEEQKQSERKAAKAIQLRAELARLEGGAA